VKRRLSQDGEMTSKRAVRLTYAPDGGSRSQLRLQSPQLSPARAWGGFAPGETTADPRTGGVDRGCVKTSARFHTSLFRSFLGGLRAFRVEKIEKNLALLDRVENFAEFLHGLDPLLLF
jgi:hypothetical protein